MPGFLDTLKSRAPGMLLGGIAGATGGVESLGQLGTLGLMKQMGVLGGSAGQQSPQTMNPQALLKYLMDNGYTLEDLMSARDTTQQSIDTGTPLESF